MSPALLNKYLLAARQVAEHMVLTPEGIAFAPHPVVTDTDRDKYCVKRIVEFYQRQPTNIAEYLLAAWCYQQRDDQSITLTEIARPATFKCRVLTADLGMLCRNIGQAQVPGNR